MFRTIFIFLSLMLGVSAAELKVATLHPLLADLARQIGGERVEVIELVTAQDDPHHFEPSPDRLRRMGKPQLCLASGMGLESDLKSLKGILPEETLLIEVGASIPSIEGSCDYEHHHHEGHEDPHWWHSVDAFKRATSIVRDAFIEANPEGADYYRAQALSYRRELDALEKWTRREIAQVSAERRVLATAHAAFGYFCHDYEFTAIPVQGINREQMPDAQSLAKLIEQVRSSGVPAIFPEASSNPKILSVLTSDTGVKLAPPLISDGATDQGYIEMMRYNVETIVAALTE